MTGTEIYQTACLLSGYSDANMVLDGTVVPAVSALHTVNRALADIHLPALSAIGDTVDAGNVLCDACCYGAARLLAVSHRNTAVQNDLTAVYNAKRSAALAEIAIRKDIIPTVGV